MKRLMVLAVILGALLPAGSARAQTLPCVRPVTLISGAVPVQGVTGIVSYLAPCAEPVTVAPGEIPANLQALQNLQNPAGLPPHPASAITALVDPQLAGFTRYRSSAGYTLAVPSTWTRTRGPGAGNEAADLWLQAPDSGTYVFMIAISDRLMQSDAPPGVAVSMLVSLFNSDLQRYPGTYVLNQPTSYFVPNALDGALGTLATSEAFDDELLAVGSHGGYLLVYHQTIAHFENTLGNSESSTLLGAFTLTDAPTSSSATGNPPAIGAPSAGMCVTPCRDGTCSSSTGSGTCSSHGGEVCSPTAQRRGQC